MAMTAEEFGKLEKPSELLRVVLDDYKSIDRDLYYPYAGRFHEAEGWDYPPRWKGKCIVCDAGMVMAGTLGGNPNSDIYPRDYDEEIEARLDAIDSLRNGELVDALHLLSFGSDPTEDDELPDDVLEAAEVFEALYDPPDFESFDGWNDMDQHAQSLETYIKRLEKHGF